MGETSLSFMIVTTQSIFMYYGLQPVNCFWNQFGGSCLAFVLINHIIRKKKAECLRGRRVKYFSV